MLLFSHHTWCPSVSFLIPSAHFLVPHISALLTPSSHLVLFLPLLHTYCSLSSCSHHVLSPSLYQVPFITLPHTWCPTLSSSHLVPFFPLPHTGVLSFPFITPGVLFPLHTVPFFPLSHSGALLCPTFHQVLFVLFPPLPHSRCTAFTFLKPGALLSSSSYLCLCPSPHTRCPSFPSRIWHPLFPSSPLVPSYPFLTDAYIPYIPFQMKYSFPLPHTWCLLCPSSHLCPFPFSHNWCPIFPTILHTSCPSIPLFQIGALLSPSSHQLQVFPSLSHRCPSFHFLTHGAFHFLPLVPYVSHFSHPVSAILLLLPHNWCLHSPSSYLVPSFPFLTQGAILSLSSH